MVHGAHGQDLSSNIKVKNLYIETEKRVLTNREYFLVDQYGATNDLNLGLDLEMPASIYFNNKITSITDDSQFRFVGYNFEIGAEPIKGIEVYFEHFSGHALDQTYVNDFPQFNKVGIRWNFIKND
jgi:hypothetical protein